MGESETGAQNQTAAPTENLGAGPQTAGTNAVLLLLTLFFLLSFFNASDCF